MTVVLRTTGGDPAAVVPAARQVVAAIDPQLPIARVQTMRQVVSASVNQPRLLTALAALFGVMAALLAAVGVYGVMAYNVRRERRELGVRLALGADPARLRRLVVWRGFMLGVLGVTIGALGAWWMGRAVQAMLTDVEATDPQVFALTAALLVAISLVSVYLPARQASRTDPMAVLRD
jgi:ABC-type antimicrobial peptide transport system permease subunit